MLPGRLIIRADATGAIGHGHVMRCLALAQAWQDQGGECTFATEQLTVALKQRLGSEGFDVIDVNAPAGADEDATQLVDIARARNAAWIAVDGYQFGADFHRSLKAAVKAKTLAIDDHGYAGAYFCDLILDQNAGASENTYERRGNASLLLGPRYALLRREFIRSREWKRNIPRVARKLLVTMGGTDPDNVTQVVIEALNLLRSDDQETRVVVGGGNSHVLHLQQLAERSGRVRLFVDPPNMAELMAWADVAVSSAGSTCWELCALGLPAILVDIAPNQSPVAKELEQLGAAVHMPQKTLTIHGLANEIQKLVNSAELRLNMSTRASELIDGHGAARVVAAMQTAAISIRPVRAGDCHLLWEWASDPAVRLASFSAGPISWEEHQAWFANKIKDPRSLILIAEDQQGNPVGQFRADLQSNEDAEIDISISREHRGMGCGSQLIGMCVREVFTSTEAVRLHALIRTENPASMRAFERACFIKKELSFIKGHSAVHYVRTRTQSCA